MTVETQINFVLNLPILRTITGSRKLANLAKMRLAIRYAGSPEPISRILESSVYRCSPNRYAWANSADPDQTAPKGAVWSGSRSSLIWVHTVCHSVCNVLTHYSMVEPHSSSFRVITTNILGVWIFRKFMVKLYSIFSKNLDKKMQI